MPLYGEEAVEPSYGVADLQFGLDDVLAAQREETFLDLPLLSAVPRNAELTAARRFGGLTNPIYSRDQALGWLAEKGLTATDLPLEDRTYNERELSILANRKIAEIRRQEVLQGGEGGFLEGAARLGTGLGLSLLDPLNVASAFIPVVGEARYGKLVAGAAGAIGRFGVRAGVGAVEGAVGAAVLEPIIAAARRQELADYTLADSMANIAFGGLFGGGLHGIGGAIGDRLGVSGYAQQAARLARLEDSLAKVGAAADTARVTAPVDLPEVRRFDVDAEIARRYEMRVAELKAAAEAPPASSVGVIAADSPQRLANRELSQLLREWPNLSRVERADLVGGTDRGMLMREAADLDIEETADTLAKAAEDARARIPEAEGRRDALAKQAEELGARRLDAEGELVRQRVTEDLRDARAEVNNLKMVAATTDTRVKELRQGLSAEGSARKALEAGPVARAQALRAGVAQASAGQPITVDPAFRGDRPTAETAAARLADPAQQPGVDRSAAEAVDTTIAEAAADDEAALTEEVGALLKDGDAVAEDLKLAGIDEPEAAARFLESVREMAADAEELSKIARMSVVCALRSA